MSNAPESLPPLPKLPEDVVYCNVCNLDGVETHGYFKGTDKQALSKGWADQDWGITCPACVVELNEREGEDVSSGATTLAGFANALRGAKP
jgi:hypothetical protein